MAQAKKTEATIDVIDFTRGRIEFAVLGTTPLILNRMSEKAKHELLMPSGRKTAAQKAQNLKHDPLAEFRASPYMLPEESAPTLLAAIAPWFKKGIAGAAIDMGAKRAQIGRLVQVRGERIPLYGIPQIFMAVTRSADINRTPDVRTRAILPRWCTIIEIDYLKPMVRDQVIANLAAAAGVIQGCGDWRAEKGAGTYGSYELAAIDDERVVDLMASGGRTAQKVAMEDPEPYDEETAEMLTWFNAEVRRRGFEVVR